MNRFKLENILPIESAAKNPVSFKKAKHLIQLFYFALIFVSTWSITTWDVFFERQNFSPVWPLFWSKYFEYQDVVNFVMLFFIFATLVGAFFYKHRTFRILIFASFLFYGALGNSFGQRSHQLYPWLYTSFFFIFLPIGWNIKNTLENKKIVLLTIWWAQALFLLTYTLSGFGKIYTDLTSSSPVNNFSPNAFALQIAYWVPKWQEESLLGPFIINNPYLAWPFYLAAVYLLLFSFWAAVRPSLQKVWAFGLALFHIGTFLTMKIVFMPPPAFLLFIFFLDSPFINPKTKPSDFIYDLPVFGNLIRVITKKKLGN